MAPKKLILLLLGFTVLGIGAVGVAIPVLPTTPFILLSALCFSMSNEKISRWLRQSRVFGPYIENYRTKQGIHLSLKIASIAFLWTGLTVSMVIIQKTWAYIVLGIIGVCVTIHLVLIKTRKDTRQTERKTPSQS